MMVVMVGGKERGGETDLRFVKAYSILHCMYRHASMRARARTHTRAHTHTHTHTHTRALCSVVLISFPHNEPHTHKMKQLWAVPTTSQGSAKNDLQEHQ